MSAQKISVLALLASAAVAFPSAAKRGDIDYTPEGGWESVQYPKGTGENLPYYPAPPGGWENVKYPPGTGEGGKYTPTPPPAYSPAPPPTPSDCPTPEVPKGVFDFTSTFHVTATPDQVVNGTTPTGGLPGAIGYFNYGINSDLDLICWYIRLVGFQGEYSSPAETATHIHEGARGASGPPRVVFANPEPVGDGSERISAGCKTGPFTTGLDDDAGNDTGAGFRVAEIEANPSNFFTDVHSSLAVPGAVRGQLA